MRLPLPALLLAALVPLAASAAEPSVIDPSARFPEGPVWHEGKLYYVEYAGHTVKSWDGTQATVFWTGEGCGPSAVAPFGDGFLVTCYDAGTMVRIGADGKTARTIDKDESGAPFVGPNDIAPDGKGGAYFSASGPWESGPIVGKIYHMDASGRVRMLADDLHYANGLVLSADGKTLYANESEAYRVIRFAVAADGALSDRRLFVRLNELLPDLAPGAYPDGIKRDRDGNLYIGQYTAGQILVVSPDGKLLRTIEVPSAAAPNLAFSPEEDMIYIAAVDDVSAAPWPGKVYAVPAP
ncbi:MAG TPA: SMP-30/gluconolactonase/LRE family protein [Alphaproteobacteria bacterium]